jgi:hypothetical protein
VTRFLASLLVLLSVTATAGEHEAEPVLSTAELVESALLTGPGYRLRSRAALHGLQARFWLETRWGAFPVDSVELLALRIAEVPLIEALHAEDIRQALADSGIDTLGAPLQAAATLAGDPIGSAARAPAGVLRYLGQRWRKLEDQARRIGHRFDRALFHHGSPADRDGKDTSAASPWWDKPVSEAGRLLRSQAGHGRARRQLAAEFGIDPWTGNPLLRARLDELAWAVASGRIASGQLLTLASAGTAEAISAVGRAAEITADKIGADEIGAGDAPEDLRRAAAERLQRWTADDDLIYALAWRGAFPPPRLMLLLDHLDALAPASGAEALLEAAAMADSEIEARFVLNALDMLLHDPEHPPRGGQLVAAGALFGYRATDGEFVLPLPVDRLSWTAEVEAWFDHVQISGQPRRSVRVAGAISELAEQQLTRRGFSLHAYHRWPSAPPYRRPGSGG